MKSSGNPQEPPDLNKAKASKQKIIQLKEELNSGNIGINPKFEKLKVLRESYDIAKFRANELLQPHDQNLYIKVHGQRASKIYSALSTLIFLSISASKVEDLEHYIINSASQVPSSIFDLDEWSSIVKIAKDCREGDHSLLRERSKVMRKNMHIFYQLAVNPLRTSQMELKLLRSEITNELSNAQVELAGSINLIMQIISDLQSGGSAADKAALLGKLIREQTSQSVGGKTDDRDKDEELRVAREALEKIAAIHDKEVQGLKTDIKAALSRANKAEAQVHNLNEQLSAYQKQMEDLIAQVQKQEKEQEAHQLTDSANSSTADVEVVQLQKQLSDLSKQLIAAQSASALRENELAEKSKTALAAVEGARRESERSLEETISSLRKEIEDLKQQNNNQQSTSLTNLPPKKKKGVSARFSVDPDPAPAGAPPAVELVVGSDQAQNAIFSEEQLVVSLISAEAIHAASTAMSAAAARYISSLSASAPAAAQGQDEVQEMLDLQAALMDTLAAHNNVVSNNSDCMRVSSLSPREMESVSSKFKSVSATPVGSDSQSEDRLILSLISAEAIHTASIAVTEAAAKLMFSLSSPENTVSTGSLQALQASLEESLLAHGDIIRAPVMESASLKLAPPPPVTSPPTPSRVKFSPKEFVKEFHKTASVSGLDEYERQRNEDHTEVSASRVNDKDVTNAATSGEEEYSAEDREEDTLSVIYAEAMHVASVAVTEAAARLVESMGRARATSAAAEALMPTVLDLQENLADTIAEHKEVLLSPSLGAVSTTSVSAKAPLIMSTTFDDSSLMLKSSKSPQNSPVKGDKTILSLVSAEAIRTASAAVAEATEKLFNSLSAGADAHSSEVVKLELDLAESLTAHSDAVSQSQMIPAKAYDLVHQEVSVSEKKSSSQKEQEKDRKQAETQPAPPRRPLTPKEEDVVVVQNQLRSFIARAKVRRVRAEKEAAEQGVLVATKGTVQGKPGWYKKGDQLFYFCMDKDEYLLLCGPISEELYESALSADDKKVHQSESANLYLDRSGLRATRMQIETLTSELTLMEEKHSKLLQLQLGEGGDVDEGTEERGGTQSEFAAKDAEIEKLTREIAECKDMLVLLEKDRRRSLLSRHASEVIKSKMKTLTIEQVVALVRLTSMVRGFLGRTRVKRIKTSQLAMEVGILSAMANTVQGESGWYMGPNRAIFYFVMKNGEWITIAGPISEDEFEILMLSRKQKQISFSHEVLTRCSLPVVADKVELLGKGQLYCANVSDKLYICTPLDDVIDAACSPAVMKVISADDASPTALFSRADINVKNASISRIVEQSSIESSPRPKSDDRPSEIKE